jgi:hypothetical protein
LSSLTPETEPFYALAAFVEFKASLDGAADVLKQKGSRRGRVKLDVSTKRLCFAAVVEKRAAKLALLANENSS